MSYTILDQVKRAPKGFWANLGFESEIEQAELELEKAFEETSSAPVTPPPFATSNTQQEAEDAADVFSDDKDNLFGDDTHSLFDPDASSSAVPAVDASNLQQPEEAPAEFVGVLPVATYSQWKENYGDSAPDPPSPSGHARKRAREEEEAEEQQQQPPRKRGKGCGHDYGTVAPRCPVPDGPLFTFPALAPKSPSPPEAAQNPVDSTAALSPVLIGPPSAVPVTPSPAPTAPSPALIPTPSPESVASPLPAPVALSSAPMAPSPALIPLPSPVPAASPLPAPALPEVPTAQVLSGHDAVDKVAASIPPSADPFTSMVASPGLVLNNSAGMSLPGPSTPFAGISVVPQHLAAGNTSIPVMPPTMAGVPPASLPVAPQHLAADMRGQTVPFGRGNVVPQPPRWQNPPRTAHDRAQAGYRTESTDQAQLARQLHTARQRAAMARNNPGPSCAFLVGPSSASQFIPGPSLSSPMVPGPSSFMPPSHAQANAQRPQPRPSKAAHDRYCLLLVGQAGVSAAPPGAVLCTAQDKLAGRAHAWCRVGRIERLASAVGSSPEMAEMVSVLPQLAGCLAHPAPDLSMQMLTHIQRLEGIIGQWEMLGESVLAFANKDLAPQYALKRDVVIPYGPDLRLQPGQENVMVSRLVLLENKIFLWADKTKVTDITVPNDPRGKGKAVIRPPTTMTR